MSEQQLRSGVSTVNSDNGIICYPQLGVKDTAWV